MLTSLGLNDINGERRSVDSRLLPVSMNALGSIDEVLSEMASQNESVIICLAPAGYVPGRGFWLTLCISLSRDASKTPPVLDRAECQCGCARAGDLHALGAGRIRSQVIL